MDNDFMKQAEKGKEWIIEKVREIAQEEGVPLAGIRWRPVSGRDFDEDKCTLVVELSDRERRVEKRFEIDRVADSVADQRRRAELEAEIRENVKSWKL